MRRNGQTDRSHTRHRIGTLALACIIVILLCSVPLSALAATDTTAPQRPTQTALLDICIGIGPIGIGCDSGDSGGDDDRDRHEDDGDENAREDTEDGDRDNHEDTGDENTREDGEQQKPPVTLPETEPPVTTISPPTETETPPTQTVTPTQTQTAGASAPIDEEDQESEGDTTESEEDNARTETTVTTTTTAHSGDNGSNGTNGDTATTDETTPETQQPTTETDTETPPPPTTTEIPTQSQSQSSADDTTTDTSNTERTTDSTRKQTTQTATPIGQSPPTTETKQRAQGFALSSDSETPRPTLSTLPTPTQTTPTERQTTIQTSPTGTTGITRTTSNTENTRTVSNAGNAGNAGNVGDTGTETSGSVFITTRVTATTPEAQTNTRTPTQTTTATVTESATATTPQTTRTETERVDDERERQTTATETKTETETPIALMDNQRVPPFPFNPVDNLPFSTVTGGLIAAGLVALGILKASPAVSGTDVSMASSMGTTSRLASSHLYYQLRRRLWELLHRLIGWLAWVWWLIPIGYSRWDDSDPLEADRRQTVYAHIKRHPEQKTATIARETGLDWSTVNYHTRILTEERLIQPTTKGGHTYYISMTDARERDHAERERARDALTEAETDTFDVICDDGPMIVSEIADKRDRTSQTISEHLNTLEENGLITRERVGRTTEVALSEQLREWME